MIIVKIDGENKEFKSLIVKGHAESDVHGQDLICAGVSSVLTGGFNSVKENQEFEMILENGYALLKLKGKLTYHDEIVIETMITSLKTIAESYPKNIKIEFMKKG